MKTARQHNREVELEYLRKNTKITMPSEESMTETEKLKSELYVKSLEIDMLENELNNLDRKLEVVKNADNIISQCNDRMALIATQSAKIYFYDKLLETIKDNPMFQKEWINLMTIIKLSLNEDEIEKLSGHRSNNWW
jgi:pantothenate kinase